MNKIKALEARVKDAEHQATECTKRVSQAFFSKQILTFDYYCNVKALFTVRNIFLSGILPYNVISGCVSIGLYWDY